MKVKYFIGTPDQVTKEMEKFLSKEDIHLDHVTTHGDGLRLIMFLFYRQGEKE